MRYAVAHYPLPFVSLAAAIVAGGIKENDTFFLNSKWGKYLVETVLELADLDQEKRYELRLPAFTGNRARD